VALPVTSRRASGVLRQQSGRANSNEVDSGMIIANKEGILNLLFLVPSIAMSVFYHCSLWPSHNSILDPDLSSLYSPSYILMKRGAATPRLPHLWKPAKSSVYNS
jgi:hypothetical protein